MKQIILSILSLCMTLGMLSQTTGINTIDPQATLDVEGKPADENIVDGIIAPRLTGNQLKAKDALYTLVRTGAIVYVTSVPTPPENKTINVTAPGYYYFNGSVWVTFDPANIYNTNGTLTANRTMTMDDKNLLMTNGGASTLFSHLSDYALIQNSGTNGAMFEAVSGGSRLEMFTEDNNDTEIIASGTSTGLNVGTNNTTDLTLITGGADRVIVASDGDVGIATVPTERLDVASGNVRVRDINTNIGDGTIHRTVVADADGVLRTLNFGAYSLFHARLAANQNHTGGGGNVTTLLYSAPLSTSSIYTYDTATGTLTFNQVGNYMVTMQAGFANTAANTQLVMGIRQGPLFDTYIGRGSHYNAVATGASVGELMQYTTMIVVPSVGYQVRFVVAANSNCRVLASETGATGTGNVTNITVQKI